MKEIYLKELMDDFQFIQATHFEVQSNYKISVYFKISYKEALYYRFDYFNEESMRLVRVNNLFKEISDEYWNNEEIPCKLRDCMQGHIVGYVGDLKQQFVKKGVVA